MPIPTAFLINMDRSRDRLRAATRQLNAAGVPFVRVAAVDGGVVDRSALATSGDATGWCTRFCTDGMLGCALSHIGVWKRVRDDDLPCALVLEDDVELVPGFASKLRAALRQVPDDYDLLYLGCFGLCSPLSSSSTTDDGGGIGVVDVGAASDAAASMAVKPLVIALTFATSRRRRQRVRLGARVGDGSIFVPVFPSGTHCYVISAQGAAKLANTRAGFHIDTQLAATPGLNLYACSPPLASQADMNNSTLSDYSFPKLPNLLLGRINDSHGISLAYFGSVPFAQLPLGETTVVRMNAWLTFFLVLGLVAAPPLCVGSYIAAEAVLGGMSVHMAACGVAYTIGYLARAKFSSSHT